MQINEIQVNHRLMEITPHKSQELPMQVYTDYFGAYLLKYINWHWHNEFEFTIMVKGSAKFLIEDASITLKEGEGIFINSAVLHQIEPISLPEETVDFSVLVLPQFIASPEQGNIFDKYVMPVVLNGNVKHYIFNQNIPWQQEIIDKLCFIHELDGKKPYGYELLYHETLFQIWKQFVMNSDACSQTQMIPHKERTVRIRMNKMVSYIKKNYSQDITVENIAGCVNISKSECFRCFQACIGVNPYTFLQKYRIERAATLLCTTMDTVSDIAASCGFNSPSYFGMVFKSAFGKTPLSYRAQYKPAALQDGSK